jgi:hypothetical protein
MKRRELSIMALSIGLIAVSQGPSLAQTTTTTTTVYATSTPQVVTLPATGTYVVVDPLTGEAKGVFDPATGMLNGQLTPSGLIVTEKLTGRIVAVADANGRPVDVATAPAADALVASIDARRAALDHAIADALAKEQINGVQAAPLRAELDRLAALEMAARQSGGTITLSEAYPIAIGLNTLSARIDPLVTVTVSPVSVSSHFIVINGQTMWVDDFAYRKFALDRRIEDEYSAGRLAIRQKEYLKQKLSDVSAREARYRDRGDLNDSKRNMLAAKYDKVQADLDRDVSIIKEKRARIGLKAN